MRGSGLLEEEVGYDSTGRGALILKVTLSKHLKEVSDEPRGYHGQEHLTGTEGTEGHRP